MRQLSSNLQQKEVRKYEISLLQDDILIKARGRDARAKVQQWLQDFQRTDYPNRPRTQQYYEVVALARELNISVP